MPVRNITAADSIVTLTIPGLFDTPQLLSGYMADAAFATEAVNPAELVMGVDGIMSAGYTPYMTRQTFSIMPDSPTSDMFETWLQTQNSLLAILPANGVITIPATGRKYTMSNGVLSSIMSVPDAHKVLQGRPFSITWNTITAAPI